LAFDEKPDYDYLHSLFRKLLICEGHQYGHPFAKCILSNNLCDRAVGGRGKTRRKVYRRTMYRILQTRCKSTPHSGPVLWSPLILVCALETLALAAAHVHQPQVPLALISSKRSLHFCHPVGFLTITNHFEGHLLGILCDIYSTPIIHTNCWQYLARIRLVCGRERINFVLCIFLSALQL
jgi:hypothetical protein